MSRKDICSRREFLAASLAVPALIPSSVSGTAGNDSNEPVPPGASAILSVDYRKLVSRADLDYDTPATRSEEGMPIGNGRTGSLVWTTPSALKFQINRPDVFAENCETNSFPERHADYGSGCGFVDINFADFGDDVFTGEPFHQHLSVYDGLMDVQGRGIRAHLLAWNRHDVLAIEIDDQRHESAPVSVDLRMLRYILQYFEGKNHALSRRHAVKVETREQSAVSQLDVRGERVVLTQEFREGSYINRSAVAVGVVARRAKAKIANVSTLRLTAAPGKGRFTILISSASSFEPEQDVAALALDELESAAAQEFNTLAEDNRRWWRDFWSKSFVSLHSADGTADYVEQNYTYYLYLMASSSRGAYPPRFGGMIWFTNGDMREWGSQHWWANTSCYYDALPPVNHFELLEPVFSMYTKMYDSCARAARQQWGSLGIFIPETVWFDGLENLSESMSSELQDLYLVHKPWEHRSQAFRDLAEPKQPHNSRWNWKDKGAWVAGRWVFKDKGAGPFGQTSHILSSGAKIAYLYWLRYQYSADPAWLKERAYPMLKGIAELYQNFPSVRKGEDGKYHIHNVNNHEPVWCAQDTNEEISAMHGIFPLAIRASEILGVDAELRVRWQEFLDHLTPIVTNDSPGALKPKRAGEPAIWISGLPPVRKGNLDRPGLIPALYYDLCAIETGDPETLNIANATYEASFRQPITAESHIGTLSMIGAAAAHLGRDQDLKHIIPNQLRCSRLQHDFCDLPGSGETAVFRNRLSLREGPGDIEFERIGRASHALLLALLQSAPPAPGRESILRVFPAWPKDWDARYTLLARGAFLVTSSIRAGSIEFVEVLAQAGGECRLKNPWGNSAATLYRNGKKAEDLTASLLVFGTAKSESVTVVRHGSTPEQYRAAV